MSETTIDRIAWIVVLLIFVIPISFCNIRDDVADHKARIVCIEQRGDWRHFHGGTCVFDKG